MKNRQKILILILAVSAILRIGWLARGDAVNDEVFYGFRAIGPMDFDQAAEQTTPLEWWDPRIPSWTRLSFHDHPPLTFWIQHVFIKILGENNFAMRLPSALLGVVSVYLVFLLGSLLFSPTAGVVSAGFLSVTLNHVYISRVGMQESYVIFFMLLALCLFLKEKWRWLGVVLGFAFLAKYNLFILVPIFFSYLLWKKRNAFKNKDLWIGIFLSVLIFSPVVIYNIMLYRAVGHFDFQFSYIFGQNPEVWKVAPGKEIGTLADRLRDFIPRLIATHSWMFLILFAISLIFLRNKFLFLIFGFLFLLLLKIGPSYRFLTVLTPFMALSIGALMRKYKAFPLTLIFIFEIFYAYNNQIAYYPIGYSPWFSSKVRYENYNWGNNELVSFFEKEFKRKIPALTFDMKYKFLEDAQSKFIEKDKQKGYGLYPALVVTHGNFDRGAKLWGLDRLHIYHGWPIITLETYLQYLKENGLGYYENAGFKNFYFVQSANIVPNPLFSELTKNIEPISIKNSRNDEMFKIFKKLSD